MNGIPEPPVNFQQIQAPPTRESRTDTGQFAKGHSGNPTGRPPGARNRATMLAEQLFDGESEALARKAVAMALDGDRAALRLCIDRILAPRKRRGVPFDLPPIRSASDFAPAMTAIVEATAQGILSTAEAADMAHIVETAMRAIEAGDIDQRLRQLEAVHGLGTKDGD